MQQSRILRSLTEPIYIIDYVLSSPQWTFSVKGSTDQVYQVLIHHETGNTSCSCMDYSTRCQYNQCLCKHLCFFWTRMLKKDNVSIQFSSQELDSIKHSLTTLYQKELDDSRLEDSCPICLETLSKDHHDYICPQCLKNVHQDCMKQWAKAKRDYQCVYCRHVLGSASTR